MRQRITGNRHNSADGECGREGSLIEADGKTRQGMFVSFRYRDFRLLWTGAFVSNLGTWIHNTALMWQVKEWTGSNSWVGLVNLASFLPVFLFILWSGSLADRLDRRKLIISTQSLMMLGAFSLGLYVSLGFSSLSWVICITAFMGTAFVFNFPAWRAIIPDLVPREHLLNGVALDASQFNLARSVGPLLGSMILGLWGAAAAFYVNAVSFLAVIFAVAVMRTRTPPFPARESVWKEMVAGIRYALSHAWSRNLLVLLSMSSFFGFSFVVVLPGLAKDVLQRGSTGLGLLLGAIGLGAFLGAPLVTFLRGYMQERTIIKAGATGFGVFLIGIALCRNLWACLFLALANGTSGLVLSSMINAVLQARVGREMRGRMMSLYILVFQGIYPLGGLFYGFLSDATSVPFTLVLGGSICVAAGLAVTAFPSLLRDVCFSGGEALVPLRGGED